MRKVGGDMRRRILAGVLFVAMAGLAPHPGQSQATDGASQSEPAIDVEALFEEAESYRLGKGVAKDLDRSLELHQRLAAEGHKKSLSRIADIMRDTGEPEKYLDALEASAASGNTSDLIKIADGHARGRFGARSDPAAGFPKLVEYAETIGSDSAKYALAEAYRNGRGTEPDHQKAIAIYSELADDGHASSQRRLGEYYYRGEEVPRDLGKATALLEEAVGNGRTSAYLSLVRAQIAAGEFQNAAETLDEAVAADASNMDYYRADYHATGRLGASSKPEFGLQELSRLAADGNTRAARGYLRIAEKAPETIDLAVLASTVEMLERKSEAGNREATEALARAYRRLPDMIPEAESRHAKLIDGFGHQMRDSRLLEEQLHLAYASTAKPKSWEVLTELLSGAGGEEYERGLLEIWKIDRNAYVYAVQTELKKAGYVNGVPDGLFTTNWVRGVLRLCRDAGDFDVCREGPLKSSARKVIARALANSRS